MCSGRPAARGACSRWAWGRRHIWESGADGAFSISEDSGGEPLGRGTLLKIYLKVSRQQR